MSAVQIENGSFAVTGGCGFIGAVVARQLIEGGAARVVVLDSLRAGRRERLPESSRVAFVQTTLGDTAVADLSRTLQGIHGVFHLAAEKHRPSLDSPRDLRPDRRAVSGATDHRHTPTRRLDSHAHHLLDFLRRQRVQLSGAARGDEAAERVARHLVHVARQRVEVQGEVLLEGRDGKSEHTSDAVSECHL